MVKKYDNVSLYTPPEGKKRNRAITWKPSQKLNPKKKSPSQNHKQYCYLISHFQINEQKINFFSPL